MSQAREANGKFKARRDEDEDEDKGPTQGDEETSAHEEQETKAQAGMHGRNETEAETPMPARTGRTEKTENQFSQAGVEKTIEAKRTVSPKNEKEALEMRQQLQRMEMELRRLEEGYPTPPQAKNERIRELFSHEEKSSEESDNEESETDSEDSSEESSTSDSSEKEEREERKKEKKKKRKEESDEDGSALCSCHAPCTAPSEHHQTQLSPAS